MAAPATVDELVNLIRKSGLFDESRLNAHLERLTQAGQLPVEPRKLAGLLIRDGFLTYFQAEQFLLGKWRGFTLGKYKLLERIGFGGMGQVFLCEHQFMRRRVAIKVLPPAKAEEPAALGRFYREARAAGTLDHPNIVRTHDIDKDGNLHFLVMEYVDGTSLLEIVKKFGPMDVTRACHYIRQAAEGLEHAFRMGLIHRDVKPGNLMLDREGVVKILDMGLARFYQDHTDLLTLKYDEKSVLGTADYVAPEQTINSHEVDVRADIYGLGATFYFLLAGHPPFPDGTVAQKLLWHQSKLPTPIQDLRPEVPQGVSDILDRMLAKDPANRFQTPLEAAKALEVWTRTPIALPPVAEMPALSPAASAEPNPAAAVPVPVAAGKDSTFVRPEMLQRPHDPPSGVGAGMPGMPVGGGSSSSSSIEKMSLLGPPPSGIVGSPSSHRSITPPQPSVSEATPITRPASLPAIAFPPSPFAEPPTPPPSAEAGKTIGLVLAAVVVGLALGAAVWWSLTQSVSSPITPITAPAAK